MDDFFKKPKYWVKEARWNIFDDSIYMQFQNRKIGTGDKNMVIKIRSVVTQRSGYWSKGSGEIFSDYRNNFYLDWDCGTTEYKCVETHYIVFLKSNHFNLCKLYLSKIDLKKIKKPWMSMNKWMDKTFTV